MPTMAGEIKRHIRDRAATSASPGGSTRPARTPSGSEADGAARQGAHAGRAGLGGRSDAGRSGPPREHHRQRVGGHPGGDDRDLDASESRLLLADAFRTLDETDRRILYLRFVGERSRREVADELGISQSALARRTNAALSKLRAELEGRAGRGAHQSRTAPDSRRSRRSRGMQQNPRRKPPTPASRGAVGTAGGSCSACPSPCTRSWRRPPNMRR